MESYAKLLKKLEINCSVAYSAVSSKNFEKLRGLIDSGVLEIVHVGAGKRIEVNSEEYFHKHINKLFPKGIDAVEAGTNSRVDSIAVHGDSKIGSNRAEAEGVLFRVFSSDTNLIRINDKSLPAKKWDDLAGCVAVKIKDGDTLSVSGSIATIENADVFWRFEELAVEVDVVFWTAGKISKRFLTSLEVLNKGSIIHFGDYDPVGVDDYLRLKEVFGSVNFYIPDNIEKLFKKYAKEDLLKKNQAIYERIRGSKDSQAIRIVWLMSFYNGGIEQEELFV